MGDILTRQYIFVDTFWPIANGLVTAGVRKRSLDSRRLELGSNRRINRQNLFIIISTFVAFDGMSTT